MKTKHLLGALLSFLYTIIFFSCGNNDEKKIYSLSFEKEYYERPLLGTTNITITGGNRDYTVTVEKTDILNIDVDLSLSLIHIFPRPTSISVPTIARTIFRRKRSARMVNTQVASSSCVHSA